MGLQGLLVPSTPAPLEDTLPDLMGRWCQIDAKHRLSDTTGLNPHGGS
jgi:hypothetical protein